MSADLVTLEIRGRAPGQAYAPISDQNSKEDFQFLLFWSLADRVSLVSSASRYLWQRSLDGVNWTDTSSTGPSYSPNDWDVGALLRARFSYLTTSGVSGVAFSKPTSAIENVNDAPVWSSLILNGQARQDSLLSLSGFITDGDNVKQSAGRIDAQTLDAFGLPVLSFEWRADGLPIEGAVGSSFTPGQPEVGKLLTVLVSYTDAQGARESRTFAATSATANINDPPEGEVWIDGALIQGEVLYAGHSLTDIDGPSGIRSDVPGFWQWFANDKEILGANNESLLLTQPLVRSTIKVRARYTDGFNTQENIFGFPFIKDQRVEDVNDPPTGALVVTASAYQDGKPVQGSMLSAASSISNPIADLDGIPHTGLAGAPVVEWFVEDGTLVGTGPTLLLGQNLVGQRITARYSYTDLGQYRTAEEIWSATLAPVSDKQDMPQPGAVTFLGELVEDSFVVVQIDGEQLDADGINGDVILQWLANGEAISGQQSADVLLTQSEVGKSLSVRLNYVDGAGRKEILTVPVPGGSVRNLDDPPEGNVWFLEASLEQYSTLTAAHDLADADGIPAQGLSGAISYQWFLDDGVSRTALTGQTGPSLLLSQEHVNRMVSVVVSYTDNHGSFNQFEVDAGWVQDVQDLPASTLTLAGALVQNQTLSVAGGITDLDQGGAIPFEALAFRWFAGNELIVDAQGPSLLLTQDHVQKVIRVEVWYDDEALPVEIRSGSPVADADDPPVGSVRLDGEFVEGGYLWVTPEILDQDLPDSTVPAFSFAWFADGVRIPGESGDSLALGPAQVSRSIQARASYVDSFGTNHVFSDSSPLIANVPDPPEGEVTISGAPVQGGTLEIIGNLSDRDGIAPNAKGQPDFRYQWLADGQEINGATGRSFQPNQDQVGKALSVRVMYTDLSPVPQPESYETLPTDPVANVDDAPVGSLRLAGDLVEHATIAAVSDFFDADGVDPVGFSWEWFSREKLTDPWTRIPSVTNDRMVLDNALVGKLIRAELSYSDGFSNSNRLGVDSGSVRVSNVNDPASGRVWIDGYDPVRGVFQGDTVSVNLEGLGDPDGMPPSDGLVIQWYLDGKALFGANQSHLTLQQQHVAGMLQARVLFWDARGAFESLSSEESLVVQNLPDAPTGALKILGVPRIGQTLIVEHSLTDPDGTSGGLSFQWVSNNGDIAGARDTFLTLTPDLIKQTIGVRAFWTDDWGQEESVEVWLTGQPVTAPPIEGIVYHWGSRALLQGVDVVLSGPNSQGASTRFQTDVSGTFKFDGLDFDQYHLTGNFQGQALGAVDGADLLALMKILAGRNPNPDPDGVGPKRPAPTSPFQLVAADVDGSGRIDQADVAYLMMQLGKSRTTDLPWRFVNESGDRAALKPTDHAGLVGVLVGDLDGSWTPGRLAALGSMPYVTNEYAAGLTDELGMPAWYFGVA